MKGKGEEPSSCYHWGMASRELKWTRRTTENGGSASQPPLFEWAGHCPIGHTESWAR
jgi:hypothetical protein